jgi:DNA-binding NtrC family response regulator
MKILVIDDDEGILLNLRHLLELNGHTVSATAGAGISLFQNFEELDACLTARQRAHEDKK